MENNYKSWFITERGREVIERREMRVAIHPGSLEGVLRCDIQDIDYLPLPLPKKAE